MTCQEQQIRRVPTIACQACINDCLATNLQPPQRLYVSNFLLQKNFERSELERHTHRAADQAHVNNSQASLKQSSTIQQDATETGNKIKDMESMKNVLNQEVDEGWLTVGEKDIREQAIKLEVIVLDSSGMPA